MRKRWVHLFERYDWPLFISSLALTAIGLLILFGIGMARDAQNLFQVKKQFLGAGIGIALALGLSFVDSRQLRAFALPMYLFGASLLAAALLFGTTLRGGGKWFLLGALAFQPVELAKILFIVFLSAYLTRHAHARLSWTPLIGSFLALSLYVGLILLQPDFGSAAVFVVVWLVMILFCRLPRRAWWILSLACITLATLLWTVGLKSYQRDRLTSFLFPRADPYGAAYNVTQARIAIGSGGWLGKGVGEGSQARLRFLPEASTDFLFSVIGEELGFVGIAFLLFLFGLLFWRLFRIALRADDAFAGVCLVGFASLIAFHLIVNAGMNLGLLPVTGIPLPFVSAAASSLIAMFLGIGIAEAIAAH